MIRVFFCDFVLRGARLISIGGRRTRGGFSQPLGKHPQVKQGVTEGVPRRIPGTTKVTYTNKKGRTFTFSVPVAEITHPQVQLTNSSGGWREMDTSFSDLGDMEDDMPSPVDEHLQTGRSACSASDLIDSFTLFCKEYVLMDTSGMKNLPLYGELNVGPDYEHYDRRLKRKRHWLAIRHRFEDVRFIIWPEENTTAEDDGDSGDYTQVEVSQMLEALLWLEAASTFCVRKAHPADVVGEEEFLPLNLQREVAVVARHVRRSNQSFFTASQNSLELFIACAALCVKHGVPFSAFFALKNVNSSDGACIFVNMPFVNTTLGAVRMMSILGGISNAYVFSDATGAVERKDVMEGLLKLMSLEAFGEKDALENVGENELCIIMRFCVDVKEQNLCFFLLDVTKNKDEESFLTRYKQLSSIALARCRHLLYRLDGPRTQVMSEGGYIPFVDMQQHSERANKDAFIHYNLGIRSAQGLRRVALGAQSSAQLAELVERLEVGGARASGSTLLTDLVHHMSHKTAAGKAYLTLKDVNIVLPLLARMRRETSAGTLHTSFERLLANIETTIGIAMQQDCSMEELVNLVEGLAACSFQPSSFRQVEMVLLRLMVVQTCSLSQVTRVLAATSALLKGDVSHVLLQSAASYATVCSKSTNITGVDADQLVELLRVLASCNYSALPGLIALCRETCLSGNVKLSVKGHCKYAALLASAALTIKDEEELLFQFMTTDSRRHFIEYVRNISEHDIDHFVDCVTGLAAIGFGASSETEEEKEVRSALVDYLQGFSLTYELCTTLPAILLANLLESVLLWGSALEVHTVAVAAPLEQALMERLRSFCEQRGVAPKLAADDLAEAACRVVGLRLVTEELRKVAAETLGRAVLYAEADADALRSTLQQQQQHQGRSFEIVALSNAEREGVFASTVLRYCAAIEQSGMAHHVAGLEL